MAEGKIFGTSSVLCGICEEDDSVQYCNECLRSLCARCVKTHGNIPSTRKHTLVALHTSAWQTKKCASSPRLSCTTHNGNNITHVCYTCWSLKCKSCNTGCCSRNNIHFGRHTNNVKPIPKDSLQIDKICLKKIKHLSEVYESLDHIKESHTQKSDLVKKARQTNDTLKQRLEQIMKEDAARFFNKVESDITSNENILSEISANINCYMKDLFQIISHLEPSSKVSDPYEVLQKLCSAEIKVKMYKDLVTKSQTLDNLQKVLDVLPFAPEVELKLANLKDLLASGPTKRVAQHRNQQIVSLNNTEVGNNHIGYCGDSFFRFCGSRILDDTTAIIYKVGAKDIHVFDTKEFAIRDSKCEKNIHRMESFESGYYLIIESGSNIVHILDGNFHVVSTMVNSTTCVNSGIFVLENDVFLLLQGSSEGHTRIVEVTANLKKFDTKNLVEFDIFEPQSLFCFANRCVSLAYNKFSLCEIHLDTGSRKSVLNATVGGKTDQEITDLHISSSGMLYIVDSDGYIQVFQNGERVRIINYLIGKQDPSKCRITGITIKGGKIVLITGEVIRVFDTLQQRQQGY